MKKRIITFLALTTFLISNTYGDDNQTLNCIDSILSGKRFSKEIVDQVPGMLMNLGNSTNKCLKLQEKLLKLPKYSRKEVLNLHEENIKNVFADSYVIRTMQGMINPQFDCDSLSFEVAAALGAGAMLGTEIGICKGSNGKRFLVNRNKIAFALGVGATVTAQKAISDTEFSLKNFIAITSNGVGGSIGIGLAVKIDDYLDLAGAGVGAGFVYHTMDVGVTIPILPLPKDWRNIKHFIKKHHVKSIQYTGDHYENIDGKEFCHYPDQDYSFSFIQEDKKLQGLNILSNSTGEIAYYKHLGVVNNTYSDDDDNLSHKRIFKLENEADDAFPKYIAFGVSKTYYLDYFKSYKDYQITKTQESVRIDFPGEIGSRKDNTLEVFCKKYEEL